MNPDACPFHDLPPDQMSVSRPEADTVIDQKDRWLSDERMVGPAWRGHR